MPKTMKKKTRCDIILELLMFETLCLASSSSMPRTSLTTRFQRKAPETPWSKVHWQINVDKRPQIMLWTIFEAINSFDRQDGIVYWTNSSCRQLYFRLNQVKVSLLKWRTVLYFFKYEGEIQWFWHFRIRRGDSMILTLQQRNEMQTPHWCFYLRILVWKVSAYRPNFSK